MDIGLCVIEPRGCTYDERYDDEDNSGEYADYEFLTEEVYAV